MSGWSDTVSSPSQIAPIWERARSEISGNMDGPRRVTKDNRMRARRRRIKECTTQCVWPDVCFYFMLVRYLGAKGSISTVPIFIDVNFI